MKEAKISSINLFIIFFLSYSFYTIQILTQQLFYSYSKQAVIIICIFYLLFPIVVYLICKIINKNKLKYNSKNNFIFSILTSLYLLLTTIIAIINICNIILIYYYQQTSIIILLAFLILPIIYTILKNENSLFYLATILLIIYVLFKYAYLNNSTPIDYYTFYNIFKIDNSNILPIIVLSLPILIEPIILINNYKDLSNKVNVKVIVILSIIFSLVGIITILRQTWEFGNLLDKIRFPYLESAKNIVAGKFFENIDYYYLLSLSVSIYTRLGYALISIKKAFNLNKLITIILLSAIVLIVYFMQSNMQFYDYILSKVLMISSICLILATAIFPFMLKRRTKENV